MSETMADFGNSSKKAGKKRRQRADLCIDRAT